MKLTPNGAGLGRFVLSPVAVIGMLALLTTAVALAAPPTKTHPPLDKPSHSVDVDVESPDVEESDAPKASRSPGACNALNGNAPQVIATLVANWPDKHAKGDVVKEVPPGLQKVADRLAECQAAGEDPDESPGASEGPIIVDDETTLTKVGKSLGKVKDR